MIDGGLQHFRTVPSGTIGIRPHTEQRADITKVRGGQQRVDQRMCGDIAIGITRYAVAIPMQTGKP